MRQLGDKFREFLSARILRKKQEFSELERRIDYRFKDSNLLLEALSHRSYVKSTNGSGQPSFERLEFLGDSILGMIVAESLFSRYPKYPEGRLTKLKAALVNEQTLAGIAKDIGLGEFIMMSEEEASSGGRERPSITSDSLEAILGAVFLDGGFPAARRFVKTHVISRISKVRNDDSLRNYKGELLEFTQGEAAGTPRYEVVRESGPDHDKTFTVAVNGFGVELATGSGHSKKEAEQEAARKALSAAEKIAKERRSDIAGQEDA
jgi:ribonuclease-3